LSSEKKSFRTHECVLKRADADICEKRETLDVTVLIRRVLGHIHIAPTAKVGGLFLGVFTDDLHNREAVSGSTEPQPHGHDPNSFPYLVAANFGR
jgi:hypothetical protein